MQMTKSEIGADYQAAKDPKKQIGILADLNQTTKAEIVGILRAAAVDTIARLLHSADRKEEQPDAVAIDLQEQIRGVLALVDEIDRRCDAMAEDDEEEES